MPGQLLTHSIENPLMISVNSWSWGVIVIRLVIDFWKLVKVALKNGGSGRSGGWVKSYGGCWGFGPYVCFGVLLLL
jgi:hypothetical protein